MNNDIRRNLTTPLEELKSCFQEAGADFPEICVLTRSGDTPAEERRRMMRRPPEILITTPESLNILISSRAGRAMLTGIATVILDEIHAVVGTKRGTHLITAVERLVLLSGEFQRIALSATVKPLSKVAEFVGGSIQRGDAKAAQYEKREVAIIQSRDKKGYEIRVSFPPDAREQLVDASRWPALAQSFRRIIRENRSTLLFANSRRTAEKVTRLINEGEPEELAYSHHGSLSREIRLAVEQRLKKGELKAIVATSSLELGIDIGDLDRVILIQTPPSIASAIQRIGRSGHSVGGMSRGLLYPTHGHDFLYAAVVAKSVIEQDIESVLPIECPLDILAQVIVSMTGIERWDIDELYAFLKTCHPYRHLSRRQFDLVLEMLAGRYADTRLRELRPRISLDRIDNTVHGKDGVLRLIYLSGGTIPDRGYYDLRIEETRAKIGELDEEFVWERRVGDTFTLGTQVWRIRKVTHNDVEVIPVDAKPGIFPFWRAEDLNRDFHFSEKILLFLEDVNARLDAPSLKEELCRDYLSGRNGGGRADRPSEKAKGSDGNRSPPSASPADRAFRRSPEHLGQKAGHPAYPVGRQDQPAVRPGPAGGMGGKIPLSPRSHREQRLHPAHAPPRIFRGGTLYTRHPGKYREAAQKDPGDERILRGEIQGKRRQGASAAARGFQKTPPPLAEPAAVEEAHGCRPAPIRISPFSWRPGGPASRMNSTWTI